jgi:ribosomal protein L11 methyltransferase
MTADGLWRIAVVDVFPGSAALFETALEPFCDTVSRFGDDDGEGDWRVEGLAGCEPDRAALAVALTLAAACRGVPFPQVRVELLPSRDWLAENQAEFPAFEIGRFFVSGSQVAERVLVGRIGLLIDPGAAFGSGRHASTAGCLTALDDLSRRRFRRALDMGCGSGILAIAIAKLWRAPVLAADADDEAVTVTRDNARLNGVGDRVRAIRADGYHAPAIGAAPPFDLIVCNILARPIRRMAASLARELAPDGVAVLSGFLARDAGGVLAAHRASGLRLARRITLDGWQTLVLTR